MGGTVSLAVASIIVILYSVKVFMGLKSNDKRLKGNSYNRELGDGMYGNYEKAKILDKPNPQDTMMQESADGINNAGKLPLNASKVLGGLGMATVGAIPIAIAGGLAKVGAPKIKDAVKQADTKLGVSRKIRGAQWFVRGMRYKVSDGVSYAKNTIANSKIGKGTGRIITGVKKITKPVTDVAKTGVILATSGLTGLSFKAQKEQFEKMQVLKQASKERNRKISQIKRSAFESVNENLNLNKKQIQDDFSAYHNERRKRIRTYTDKVIADREIAYQRERKNQAIKDLDKYYDRSFAYNNAVQSALEKANLRGYTKGENGLTKIAPIVAGAIALKLHGKNLNLGKQPPIGYSANGNSANGNSANGNLANGNSANGYGNVTVYETHHNNDNKVYINENLISQESKAEVVSTKLVIPNSVKGMVQKYQIEQGIRNARENNLTVKQGIKYANIEKKAEDTRAQQIEKGNIKPLDLQEMKKYFPSAIRHGGDMTTEEMFEAIQDADRRYKKDYFKLENIVRKQADLNVDVNKEAKKELESILENSSKTKEIFEKAVAENYRDTEAKIEEVEKQADRADDKVEKLRKVELDGKLNEMSSKIVDEVIKAVQNSEHSERAKELLGEEGYYQFEKSVKKILQDNESDFAKRMAKLNDMLDGEWVKDNISAHPEYSELGSAELRNLRQENTRERYVESSINNQRLRKNQEKISDNNYRTNWRESATVIKGSRKPSRTRFDNTRGKAV